MMIARITNARAVQPFIRTLEVRTDSLTVSIDRGHNEQNVEMDNETTINLSTFVFNRAWVEVYLDGFRIINYTRDFGNTFLTYNIVGNQIIFSQPVTGNVKIIVDNPSVDEIGLVIPVVNIQGARTRATSSGQHFGALHCEPIVLTQPVFGFARLTSDRLSILYVPPVGFNGGDAFSYTVVTDRGQIADPKCIFVQVGQFSPPEEAP